MTAAERAILRERRIKLLFFLGSLGLVFFFIMKVQNMMVSTIFAITIYYLLAPTVDFLERRGFSRLWATTVPFLTLTGLWMGSVALFAPVLWEQVKDLEKNSAQYSATLMQLLTSLQDNLSSLPMAQVDLKEHMQPLMMDWSASFFKNLPEVISQSFTVIFLVPFFAFFMLLDGRDLLRRWLGLVPNNLFELTLNLNYQIGSQIGGFIRARLIESAFVSAFCWIGFVLIGFPFALVLGLLAGILNIIPYVGPVIAAFPALVISLANGVNPTELFFIVLIFVLSQILDLVILVPFLVARIVNLHPVTVILAVLVGAQLMGIIGMIICIPVVSALKVTLIAIYRHSTGFRT